MVKIGIGYKLYEFVYIILVYIGIVQILVYYLYLVGKEVKRFLDNGSFFIVLVNIFFMSN